MVFWLDGEDYLVLVVQLYGNGEEIDCNEFGLAAEHTNLGKSTAKIGVDTLTAWKTHHKLQHRAIDKMVKECADTLFTSNDSLLKL